MKSAKNGKRSKFRLYDASKSPIVRFASIAIIAGLLLQTPFLAGCNEASTSVLTTKSSAPYDEISNPTEEHILLTHYKVRSGQGKPVVHVIGALSKELGSKKPPIFLHPVHNSVEYAPNQAKAPSYNKSIQHWTFSGNVAIKAGYEHYVRARTEYNTQLYFSDCYISVAHSQGTDGVWYSCTE